MGGSQGARALNQRMPEIAATLLDAVPGLTILHQAGARHAETTEAAYAASGAPADRWKVQAFLEDMPAQFAASDLILARSGASTVAELAASGKPSLLVPFPQAADDHQRKNAEVLVEGGAAACCWSRTCPLPDCWKPSPACSGIERSWLKWQSVHVPSLIPGRRQGSPKWLLHWLRNHQLSTENPLTVWLIQVTSGTALLCRSCTGLYRPCYLFSIVSLGPRYRRCKCLPAKHTFGADNKVL